MASITSTNSTPSISSDPVSPCQEEISSDLKSLSPNEINDVFQRILTDVKRSAIKSRKPFVYRHLFCKAFEVVFPRITKNCIKISHPRAVGASCLSHSMAALGYLVVSPLAIPVDICYAIGSRVVRAYNKCFGTQPVPLLVHRPPQAVSQYLAVSSREIMDLPDV